MLKGLLVQIASLVGLCGPRRNDSARRLEYQRSRTRRFFSLSFGLHLLVILLSTVSVRGCLYRVPAGVPMGKGDKLTMGKVKVVHVPQRVRRKRLVRQSPVSVYEMIKDEDEQADKRAAQQFTDTVGSPAGVGEGAAAAGSPRGTVLGGTLHFYRVRFDGPDWDANSSGVRPLMNEVLHAGVVKKVSGWNNVVTLKDLPKHKGEFFPNLLYMTGTGAINASDEEVKNLREYLTHGGMLFADVSGGTFHEEFVKFMGRVMPGQALTPIEFDHEIYRGRTMPYAMVRGCPLYRNHRGAGPALGLWTGGRVAVFYSRGDLGAGWNAGGLFSRRRREVDQAFRMGVNIIAYSLIYYKSTGS